jgi:SET domain-containing protein
MKYKPLPFYLTIKKSEIHGLGLYSLTEIPKDTTIGMTHIEIENDLIRTPLGGFLNHSDNPNCIRKQHNNRWFLKTKKDIDKNIELTLKYSMYKP